MSTITLAIPNSTVERYRNWQGMAARSSDEIRREIEEHFNRGYEKRVTLETSFHSGGFAVPFIMSAYHFRNHWLIVNKDTKTGCDFVVVTIYTDAMFTDKQAGKPMSASKPLELSVQEQVTGPYLVRVSPLQDDLGVKPEATLATMPEVEEYLRTLYNQGYEPDDWEVWRKVKTSIDIKIG